MLNFQNIVQQYFPEFASRHSTIARIAGNILNFLFFQRRFEQFDREYPGSEGFDFVESALTFFDFQLRTRESERAR
ncbi:MAG: GNAT family N-acetyltransferase, partial [Halieaceae bacterium]